MNTSLQNTLTEKREKCIFELLSEKLTSLNYYTYTKLVNYVTRLIV